MVNKTLGKSIKFHDCFWGEKYVPYLWLDQVRCNKRREGENADRLHQSEEAEGGCGVISKDLKPFSRLLPNRSC